MALAPIRHESVPQHEVGGNAAEEGVIDEELVQVDKLQLVTLCQPARLDLLGVSIDRRRRIDVKRFGCVNGVGHDLRTKSATISGRAACTRTTAGLQSRPPSPRA